ncbi:maleylpyruvate isomerase N-terminal domain-containing protein [Terrabacter sp. GCM10028922]|uniref:maleylpyruvate isomerase N-terminal domain-containing protein n=1 Tax=Terrabacter sp. GCM10028922 TaxID=3273428 RepID=UPI00360B4CEA
MRSIDDHSLATPGPLGVGLEELGDALGAASTVLRANAMAAGLDAPVPTCPDWTVLDLVAHQGMVHRWAASHLSGAPIEDTAALEQEGRDAPDVLGWFDEGATALLQAVVDAPDDLEAFVFLQDAPAARLFWTRRQCHETTIHAVDALSARLGRSARPDETWIRPEIAVDGIDELLVGFVTRSRRGASPGDDTSVLVRPDDVDVAWLVELATGRPIVTRRVRPESPEAGSADLTLTGEPVDLYLRLWSRRRSEPADELERWWRDTISVTW